MKLDALPYYRWLVRDYRASRKVQRMGYNARGFYRELLDEEWLEGSIPNDVVALAEICGCPVRVMERAWVEISPCFKEIDGRLVNEKLESLRTEQDTLRVKRIKAGRLGGIAKQTSADAKQVLTTAEQAPYSREEQSKAEDAHPETMLPLKTGDEYPVSKGEMEKWAECYSGVDVSIEFGKMRGWLIGHPKERKTESGIGKFISGWLSRAQGDRKKLPSPVSGPPQSTFEHKSNAISLDDIRAQAGAQ